MSELNQTEDRDPTVVNSPITADELIHGATQRCKAQLKILADVDKLRREIEALPPNVDVFCAVEYEAIVFSDLNDFKAFFAGHECERDGDFLRVQYLDRSYVAKDKYQGQKFTL